MPVFCMRGHNILRSFRSHKSAKGDEHGEHAFSIRARKASQASTATCSSTDSRRPSTSPTYKSADWDSLRLHPTVTDRVPSASTYPRHGSEDYASQRVSSLHDYADSEFGVPVSASSSGTSIVQVDGFDFEFPNGLAPMPAVHRRDPLEAPVDRRASDLSSIGTETGSSGRSEAATRRQPPVCHGDADYFMRRGDWKRRGVVFTPGFLIAGEDESFDLP